MNTNFHHRKCKNILIKVLNINDTIYQSRNEILYFYCNNELSVINNNVEILNVENCNGTFIMVGYNTLIYFYIPYTIKDSYDIIENKDNFELNDIYHFFFIPKNNEFNSINILLEIENEDTIDPAFL